MLFSQRNGLVSEKTIQRESLDAETRNLLWDVVYCFLGKVFSKYSTAYREMCEDISIQVLKISRDQNEKTFMDNCKKFFLKKDWHSCYDFVEFILEHYNDWYNSGRWGWADDPKELPMDFIVKINAVLQQESCAYRIIGDKVMSNIAETEIKEINTVLEYKNHPVSEHIQKAMQYLWDRKNPDYANSVKESITAVESLCCTVTGKPKATLGEALSVCGKTTELHPALLEAFKKLYGYTSEAGGIRHGSTELAKVDQPLAQFILVTSSAFINYVKVTQKLDL